ncbi:antitoxin PaaA2 family protein [Pseudoduganella aquatica]|uniref:antitoxin PaaA2 family protein n=1 Tax=Pseudoduganella aquatica TaxID=2660641 RepID=UPI001E2AFEEF|nr:hypothetical protein [Pseudoduganella aquatica]
MDTIAETISQAELVELIRREASLTGRKNGWHLIVTMDSGRRVLAGPGGSAQLFPTLETAAARMHGLGITAFRVDTAGASFPPDPAYEAWFRQQVQDSLDDTSPTIAHSEVEDQFAAKRAALKRKMAGG